MMRLPEQIIGDIQKIRLERETLNVKEAKFIEELQDARREIDEFLK